MAGRAAAPAARLATTPSIIFKAVQGDDYLALGKHRTTLWHAELLRWIGQSTRQQKQRLKNYTLFQKGVTIDRVVMRLSPAMLPPS